MSDIYDREEEDKELVKMVGKNPITAKIKEDSEVDDKYEIFSYVRRLTEAACHCYTDGMDWDETLDNLSKAILKLKGKEEEMLKEEDNEEEKDE